MGRVLSSRANSNAVTVFLLQLKKAFGAETAFVILADILHLVKVQVHYTALAFGIGISLTLNGGAAAFARYNLVFCHSIAL
jgi:hypothetical protein